MQPSSFNVRSLISLGLLALMVVSFSVGALAGSYRLWAAGGILFAFALLGSIPLAAVFLVMEIRSGHPGAALWPALLLGFSILILLGILGGGALVGL